MCLKALETFLSTILFLTNFLVLFNSSFAFAQASMPVQCTNMLGSDQPCSKNEMETFFSYKLTSFVGDQQKSFTGSYSHGFSMTSVTERSNFSFLLGLQGSYGNMLAYINSLAYSSRLMGIDVPLGFSIKFFRSTWLRPVIDLYGLVGFRSLEVMAPPSGVDNKTMSFSYGYGVGLGFELGVSRKTAVRVMADYEMNSAQNLANQSGFKLDALAYRIGLVFSN